MTRQPIAARLQREEGGFTLVELLVTMMIGVVVLFAILGASEFLGRTSQASSSITDSQELGRRAVRSITADARQAYTPAASATPLVSVARDQIVFAAALTSTQNGWVAYCADSSGNLRRGTRTTLPYAAPVGCATGSGWTFGTIIDQRLAGGARLFSFTAPAAYTANSCPQQPSTPAIPNPPACLPTVDAVRAIGLRVAVSERASGGGRVLVTRAAVSLRNSVIR